MLTVAFVGYVRLTVFICSHILYAGTRVFVMTDMDRRGRCMTLIWFDVCVSSGYGHVERIRPPRVSCRLTNFILN
jgi:hypothetical protein